MKKERVAPGARRLIQSLCDMGYECNTAVADLIDNSIVAKASNIFVDIQADSRNETCVVIADDGDGMDRATLLDAMRFGSLREYTKQDLGKYGLGLKTASLSQCEQLTVATKLKQKAGKRSKLLIARWDLEHINKKNEWELFVLERKDLKKWEEDIIDNYIGDGAHGTVVLWERLEKKMPLLYSKIEKKRDDYFINLLTDIQKHLSVTFHRFLQGAVRGRKKVKIHVGDKEIESWDPFCLEEKKTTFLDPKPYNVSIDGKTFEVVATPYLLPRDEDYSSNESRKKAGGTKNMNRSQGFYFYRNGRLLKHGGWSRLRTNDEHYKLVRVAIDFPPNLDKSFSINITKMTARVPSTIRNELKSDSAKWIKKGRQKYDKKTGKSSKGGASSSSRGKGASSKSSGKGSNSDSPAKTVREKKLGNFSITISPSATKSISVVKNSKGKPTKIVIPSKSVLVDLFRSQDTRTSELSNLCLILFGLLESLHNKKTKPSEIPIKELKKEIGKII